MRTALMLVAVVVLAVPAGIAAQMPTPVEPFNVGTFAIDGTPTVALVLREQLIVDIAAANRDLELEPEYVHVEPPADMLELIGQYEYGLRYRLYEIVNHLVATNQLTGSNRAVYVHDISEVRTLPPIMYPSKILNAAVNFYSHVNEGGTPAEREAAQRQRREQRGVPYMFLKPTRGALIGNGENIIIPSGRDRADWEVEISTVIGRPARYVSARRAQDYVFGYTVYIDISDRGGRPPGGYTAGSDWFVGKGHDTSAPHGPWIVPKEFYGDPMQRLHQTLVIDGVTLQSANAGDMIHSLWELIEYASSISTLFPGDIINSGTSGGTLSGAAASGAREGYLRAGETIVASVEGIGTLRMPVIAGPPPPDDLTGAYLPPVSTYRRN